MTIEVTIAATAVAMVAATPAVWGDPQSSAFMCNHHWLIIGPIIIAIIALGVWAYPRW